LREEDRRQMTFASCMLRVKLSIISPRVPQPCPKISLLSHLYTQISPQQTANRDVKGQNKKMRV
jgi:hypothetical protein